MIINEKLTSINVTGEVKKDFLDLQRKHRYKNASIFVSDMVFYFESNDISPRQKDSVKKQIQLFRESLFKKLGALERDYHKPHYGDFNLVSQYIKDQFEQTQKMISTIREKQPLKKELDNQALATEKEAEKSSNTVSQKKLESIEYLLSNFEKKFAVKGEKITVDEERYTQLKLSLLNIIKRD